MDYAHLTSRSIKKVCIYRSYYDYRKLEARSVEALVPASPRTNSQSQSGTYACDRARRTRALVSQPKNPDGTYPTALYSI